MKLLSNRRNGSRTLAVLVHLASAVSAENPPPSQALVAPMVPVQTPQNGFISNSTDAQLPPPLPRGRRKGTRRDAGATAEVSRLTQIQGTVSRYLLNRGSCLEPTQISVNGAPAIDLYSAR